ncbi:hypothetical protein CU669_05245 [Paramagnetospirillum kuznetsovii]|uniref:PAS domain-containing protein n=1 Tax=Paramagnetospirillum kuznetsovii TaxID=2053833 RepID=A0A364P0D1_9PROT|nr:hypothetical protein [Paramagnetospirillum kuznetsovii]RAU22798.1 hypothetical protein CU669_05245 [Paramagnetospirillum kuznetsovii]
MSDRSWIALIFAGLGLAGSVAPAAVALWTGEPLGWAEKVSGVIIAGLFAMAWSWVDHLLLGPSARLAADIQDWLTGSAQERPLGDVGLHSLGALPDVVGHLCDAARIERQGLRQAARTASDRAQEQRAWLDVALRDLAECVVVCDLDHRVLFHNRAAERLLAGVASGFGLGALVPRASLDHALDCLKARLSTFGKDGEGLVGTTVFACPSRSGRQLLHGQMSLVLGPRRVITGYVAVFRDMSENWADLDPRDAVRQALTRDLRGPLGSLYAAAQMLTDYPDMAAADRSKFVGVVAEESVRMSNRLEAMAAGSSRSAPEAWPMADIHFSEVYASIAATLEHRLDIKLTMVGVPLWLHGDSHSLMEAFLALFAALHAHTGSSVFDMECMLGDRRVYMDINWKGDPVADHRLTHWLDAEINTALGPQRVRDVLDRHDSEPWSLSKRGGFAALRVPLPLARRAQFTDAEWTGLGSPSSLTEADIRAELLVRANVGAFAGRKLDHMAFLAVAVVTPLGAAQAGDRRRITALGAVRIEDGRLLTARSFERKVAADAEGSADGKPPLAVVLPQFWAFADDAVLAFHGIGSALGLLEDREGQGIHPLVVDTMMISSLLDPIEPDHSLEETARRLGIRVGDHRTEIGKALITAEILIRQIDRLKESGIHDFGQLMDTVRGRLARAEALVES